MRDYRPHGAAAVWVRLRDYWLPDLAACVLGMAGMIGAAILAAAMA